MRNFGKTTACPSSEILLLFNNQSLPTLLVERVNRHLADCDFCGAETAFLSKYLPMDQYLPQAVAPLAALPTPLAQTFSEKRAA
jgi:hypothetical protein